jgi:uncharacterized iron-regulated membrane protein
MIRRYLVWQHRWIGLLMTGFLIIIGLTGAMLAYKVQIDHLLNPQLFAEPKPGAKLLDLATLAERAEALEPKARVWYFYNDIPGQVSIRCVPRTNPATGKPHTLDFDHIILNPWTGEELGRRFECDVTWISRLSFMPFIYSLHTSLLLGGSGWAFIGYVALAWTLDCFVGFYLTLPVGSGGFWRRWKTAWRVRWAANAFRLNFDLHRAGGLWVWPMLFVFAWSGVMFNLNPVYEKVTRTLFDYRSEMDSYMSVPKHPTEHPKLGWHEALAKCEKLMTEQAALHGFTVQRPSGLAYIDDPGVYSYTVQSSWDFRRRSPYTGLWLDGETGELRSLFLPSGEHTGNTIGNWLWALHYGDVYGLKSYRCLVCFIGLLVVMLSVTGVYIWWRKRRAGVRLPLTPST